MERYSETLNCFVPGFDRTPLHDNNKPQHGANKLMCILKRSESQKCPIFIKNKPTTLRRCDGQVSYDPNMLESHMKSKKIKSKIQYLKSKIQVRSCLLITLIKSQGLKGF